MKSNFDVIKHSFFIAEIKNINYLNSNIYLITANFEKIIWDMIPLNSLSTRTKYEKKYFLNLTSPLKKGNIYLLDKKTIFYLFMA